LKGAKDPDAPPIGLPKKMDINAKQSAADRFGLKLWRPGTQLIKDRVASMVKLGGNGPGRMHFYENVRPDFFDQMTGEVKAPHRSIKNKLVWQPKAGQAIEAWDCTVYSVHAALAEKLDIKKPDWWENRRATLIQGDLLGGSEAPDNLVTSIDHRPTVADHEVTAETAAGKTTATVTQTKAPALTMAELAKRMGNH